VLPFGVTDVEFALVTFFSAFVGIALVVGASKLVQAKLVAAFALGVYLWFFTDTLAGANYLDVNGGFALSSGLVALFLLFAIGLVFLFSLDKGVFNVQGQIGRSGLLIAALAAFALGLHSFGEGALFGYTAAHTPSNSLLDAFGGLAPGSSWVFHKMLEPAIAAACYVAFAGPATRGTRDKLADALLLSTVFVVLPVVGSVLGYYVTFDTTYTFAFGLGASVYVLARVGRALYASDANSQPWLSIKVAFALLVGFLLIFVSALLHA